LPAKETGGQRLGETTLLSWYQGPSSPPAVRHPAEMVGPQMESHWSDEGALHRQQGVWQEVGVRASTFHSGFVPLRWRVTPPYAWGPVVGLYLHCAV